MADFLVFEGVSKSYGDIRAVDSVSFSINKGEIFSLLGPSGCGKTTLLRCCAGFEDPDAGRIILDVKKCQSYFLSAFFKKGPSSTSKKHVNNRTDTFYNNRTDTFY